MKRITSRDNPRLKDLKGLVGSTRRRRDSGRALIEGIHLCAAFLDAAEEPLSCVVVEDALHAHETAQLIARVAQDRVVIVSPGVMDTLSTVKTGANMLFEIAVPLLALPSRVEGDAIVLDRIQDPGNLGSMLRSAAAAGIRQIFCGAGCAQAWSPKVLRAAMGAHFSLRIWEECDLGHLLAHCDAIALSTSPHVERSLYAQDLRPAAVWVFGHEGQGVDAALAARTVALSIPQPGGLESLNVAAAAAVCLFEQVRQRR